VRYDHGMASFFARASALAWPCLALACGSHAGALSAPAPASSSSQAATWSPGVPLPGARFEAYAATAGSKIWFLGGITGVDGDIRTAQTSTRVDVFDPSGGAWQPGPDLPADGPKHHLAVATWQDRIYVLGGFDGILDQRPGDPFRPIADAFVLDGGAWRRIAKAPLARGGATAQAIDGKIYVTGGAPTEGMSSYAELDVYDVARDTWSMGPPMPTAREHLASCQVDGRMVVVGGWAGAARIAQNVVEVFDPAASAWQTLPPLSVARGGLAAVAVDGACHVVGGEDWALPPPGTFGTHEVLDRGAPAWRTEATMPTARHGLGLAQADRALYAVGGGPSEGNSYTATVEVFR
jgi:hypothetical protein